MTAPATQHASPHIGRTAECDLAGRWWTIALRGAIALVFGITALVQPGLTILVLVTFFGVYALFDGVLAIFTAVWAAEHRMRWWSFVVEGLVGVGIGILALARPGVRLRRELANEWLLAASGVLSILFGCLLFVFPAASAVSVVWVIGAYAVVFGILLLSLAVKLRRLGRERAVATTG